MRTTTPRKFLPAVLALLAAGCSAAPLVAREWTDSTGKFKIEANVQEYDGKKVKLQLADGGSFSVPVDKLSTADVDFLKKTYPDGLKTKPMKPAKGAKVGDMTVEVVGLTIVKQTTVQVGDEKLPGTHLRLVISDPERSVVGIDPELSKIASCTDDKGTDLFGGNAPPIVLLQVAPDGKTGIVDLHQPELPAAKATKIQIKGELHIRCGGLGEESDTVKVPLNLTVGLGL